MILLISPTDLIAQSHKVFNLATEVQASRAKPAGTGLSLKKNIAIYGKNRITLKKNIKRGLHS